MATPTGIAAAARQVASRYALGPTRFAAMKDLHQFLGHQREPNSIKPV